MVGRDDRWRHLLAPRTRNPFLISPVQDHDWSHLEIRHERVRPESHGSQGIHCALEVKASLIPTTQYVQKEETLDEKLKEKFSDLMYALTKLAARDSFMDFLSYHDIDDDEWKAIKAHLKSTYGVKTYC